MRSIARHAAAAAVVLLCCGTVPAAGATEQCATVSGSTRVLFSLDCKRNDQALISLIRAARTHVYFAIYEFTLRDVADALVAARRRGLEVRGLVDRGESARPYMAPIVAELTNADIPVEVAGHPDGNGIMHIKALVTDSAYAIGSYNWTGSATGENDELLEIGRDPKLVAAYRDILLRLFDKYRGGKPAAAAMRLETYGFRDAREHVGERAIVQGRLVRAYTAASGTVFLDFCRRYSSCPFAAVIFADDAPRFGDLRRYEGRTIRLRGKISSYRGRAEIKLSDPGQIELQAP